jgi:hypothetical protein
MTKEKAVNSRKEDAGLRKEPQVKTYRTVAHPATQNYFRRNCRSEK